MPSSKLWLRPGSRDGKFQAARSPACHCQEGRDEGTDDLTRAEGRPTSWPRPWHRCWLLPQAAQVSCPWSAVSTSIESLVFRVPHHQPSQATGTGWVCCVPILPSPLGPWRALARHRVPGSQRCGDKHTPRGLVPKLNPPSVAKTKLVPSILLRFVC